MWPQYGRTVTILWHIAGAGKPTGYGSIRFGLSHTALYRPIEGILTGFVAALGNPECLEKIFEALVPELGEHLGSVHVPLLLPSRGISHEIEELISRPLEIGLGAVNAHCLCSLGMKRSTFTEGQTRAIAPCNSS